jgi:hypothetical protein
MKSSSYVFAALFATALAMPADPAPPAVNATVAEIDKKANETATEAVSGWEDFKHKVEDFPQNFKVEWEKDLKEVMNWLHINVDQDAAAPAGNGTNATVPAADAKPEEAQPAPPADVTKTA